MSPRPCRPLAAVPPSLLLVLAAACAAPPPPPERLSKRAAASSARAASASAGSAAGRSRGARGVYPFRPGVIYTLRGTYVGFDAAAGTAQIRVPGIPMELAGLVTPESALSHGGAAGAPIGAFVSGEPVVARLRMRPRNTTAPPPHADGLVVSLADAAGTPAAVGSTPPAAAPGSRTQVVVGTVAANVAGWLDVRVSVAGAPGTPPGSAVYTTAAAPPTAPAPAPSTVIERFRVTARTQFYKDGRPASPAAYPAGSPVAVKPRTLPGGRRMAAIVAESAAETAAYYRDGLTVWRGRVASANAAAGTLLLARDDGAQRTVAVDALTVIHKQRRSVGLAALAAGDPVSVHLRKGAFLPPGYRVAGQVTVASPRASAAAAAPYPAE